MVNIIQGCIRGVICRDLPTGLEKSVVVVRYVSSRLSYGHGGDARHK